MRYRPALLSDTISAEPFVTLVLLILLLGSVPLSAAGSPTVTETPTPTDTIDMTFAPCTFIRRNRPMPTHPTVAFPTTGSLTASETSVEYLLAVHNFRDITDIRNIGPYEKLWAEFGYARDEGARVQVAHGNNELPMRHSVELQKLVDNLESHREVEVTVFAEVATDEITRSDAYGRESTLTFTPITTGEQQAYDLTLCAGRKRPTLTATLTPAQTERFNSFIRSIALQQLATTNDTLEVVSPNGDRTTYDLPDRHDRQEFTIESLR